MVPLSTAGTAGICGCAVRIQPPEILSHPPGRPRDIQTMTNPFHGRCVYYPAISCILHSRLSQRGLGSCGPRSNSLDTSSYVAIPVYSWARSGNRVTLHSFLTPPPSAFVMLRPLLLFSSTRINSGSHRRAGIAKGHKTGRVQTTICGFDGG